MDKLTERLKEKKPEDHEEDTNKKEKIMGMHAEGDEIGQIRCESCGQHFPGSELQEKNGSYYCSNCLSKIQSPD